jgi:hypothetical protein
LPLVLSLQMTFSGKLLRWADVWCATTGCKAPDWQPGQHVGKALQAANTLLLF